MRGARGRDTRRRPAALPIALATGALVCTLLASACAKPEAAPARIAGGASEIDAEADRLRGLALDRWEERTVRLQRISQRIRVAGRDLCSDDLGPVLGAAVQDIFVLPAGLQRVARERYGAREGLVVLSVFDDVREGKKGLQAGDLIVALNGRAIDEIADLSRRSDPHVRIELLRAGKPLSIEANPAVGCRFPAELHLSEEVNAYATGESVSVTTAFMREFSDDTMVAMVVGHELAHDFMEDTRRTRDGSQRRREARADHLGIYLAVMAGYPVTEKLDLYLELERDLNLLAARSQSHPITADRAAAYLKTIEEIEQRRAAGLPLLQEP